MADFENKNLPPDQLAPEDLSVKPPITLEWLGSDIDLGLGRRADARIRLVHRGESKTFIVKYKNRWTAATLKSAIEQVKNCVELSPNDLPLVVLPYLSSEAFHVLAESGVSGLDLVGNGLIEADHWLIVFGGTPNPFRDTQIIKSPYQGKSALVARTLFSCPVLPNAEALRTEIKQRGGEVSQPVISRALKALREDLVVGHQGEFGLVVLQPGKLLDRLTEQWKIIVDKWRATGHTVLWSGRVEGSPAEVLPQIFQQTHLRQHQTVMTGLSSTAQRTHLTLETTRYLYSNAIGPLLDKLDATSTRRFPNLEIWFPPDEAVFFDVMTDESGVRWASPLQTYLELVTGDARRQQSAPEFRAALIEEAEVKKAKVLHSDGGVLGMTSRT